MSSCSPGASPMNMTLGFFEPSPGTAFVLVSESLHFLQTITSPETCSSESEWLSVVSPFSRLRRNMFQVLLAYCIYASFVLTVTIRFKGLGHADNGCCKEAACAESQVTLQSLPRLRCTKPGPIQPMQEMPRPQLALEETRTRRQIESAWHGSGSPRLVPTSIVGQSGKWDKNAYFQSKFTRSV